MQEMRTKHKGVIKCVQKLKRLPATKMVQAERDHVRSHFINFFLCTMKNICKEIRTLNRNVCDLILSCESWDSEKIDVFEISIKDRPDLVHHTESDIKMVKISSQCK